MVLSGLEADNLTILKDFFIENEQIIYWRLEVIYSFALKTSIRTFDIEVNAAPTSGICSIDPLNGSITTLFTIICSNWFDQDGIKDYIIYGLYSSFYRSHKIICSIPGRQSHTPSEIMMLAYSIQPVVQIRLPASIDPQSTVHLIVHIGDTFNAVYEFLLSPVTVLADYSTISNFITALTKTTDNLSSDPIFQLLTNGDSDSVGQIATSLSQVFNEMYDQSIEFAARSKYFLEILDEINLSYR